MTKRRLMASLAGVVGLVALGTACTPDQIQHWMDWHSQDPAAAEAFANAPENQALIHQDWDHDGVVEPDPAPQPQRQTTTTRATTTRSSGSSSRSSGGSSTGASGVNWDAVARCESGGQWNHGQVTNRYGTFSGGLMIMNSAWRSFGGTQFAPYAGAASKAEQIIVAERIAARVGAARAWQCPTPHR